MKVIKIFTFLISSWLLVSCNTSKWSIQPEYIGKWQASKSKITVRTEEKWMKFEFMNDSAEVNMEINADKTVSGFIGMAKFENGRLKENPGFLPASTTGVIYIVECGSIGKIFPNDPLNKKEVELWFSPLKGNTLEAELRLTEGGSKFPMAGLFFSKLKDP
jgi:hypothetical protein